MLNEKTSRNVGKLNDYEEFLNHYINSKKRFKLLFIRLK